MACHQRPEVHVSCFLRHICSFFLDSPHSEPSFAASWQILGRSVHCRIISMPLRNMSILTPSVSNQSILFSCFEAWLIASAHDLGLPDAELSSILSRCTFINGIVAALSGVFSNVIVNHFGTVKAPFVSSAVCLGLAALAIRTTWTENYGSDAEGSNGRSKAEDTKVVDEEARQPLVDGAGHNANSNYKPGSGVIQAVLKGRSVAC